MSEQLRLFTEVSHDCFLSGDTRVPDPEDFHYVYPEYPPILKKVVKELVLCDRPEDGYRWA